MSTHPADAHPQVLQLLRSLPVCVALLDAQGRVLELSPSARALLGREGEQSGEPDFFRELLPELEAEGIGARYREEVRDGCVEIDHRTVFHATSGNHLVAVSLRTLPDEGSARAIAFIEDRSGLETAQAQRDQAERLAGLGREASAAAHEINNPLAAIRSLARLLGNEVPDPAHQQALHHIVDETARIAASVEKLLSRAREQGANGRALVNLSEIAARMVGLRRFALEKDGIEIRLDLDAVLPPVRGETGALEQAVLNLLENAHQALHSVPEGRLLIVRTRDSSEGVVLTVVDNGPGIPRARLYDLFEPPGRRAHPESGVGLQVTAAILRDHAGHIWAESEEGRGTAVHLRVPRAPVAAASGEPVEPTKAVQPARRPLRVLVADDEPNLRLAIAMYLDQRGHEVYEAATADEAAALAESTSLDVALVDARMPGDGLHLLERLEQMPSLHGRTALMTGHIDRARQSQSVATERPCLAKPFDLDEMAHIIEKLGQKPS